MEKKRKPRAGEARGSIGDQLGGKIGDKINRSPSPKQARHLFGTDLDTATQLADEARRPKWGGELRHVVRLPHGFTATFIFVQPDEICVVFEPDVPLIRNPRARRKMLAAYRQGRNEFFETIATLTNRRIATVDVCDGGTRVEGISITRPASRQ